MKASNNIFKLGFDRNQDPSDKHELLSDRPIPKWLNGSFIRNGPGLFYIGKKRFNHWFDGLAMLHKFDFEQGRVHYQSKFLECHASEEALGKKKFSYAEFATDPCWGIFGRLRSMFNHGPTDSAKVSLAKVGDQFFAMGETTMQIEFDPDTLKTVGKYNFNQPKFGTSSTAHPHIVDSKAINLITKYGPLNSYQLTQMDKEATSLASVWTLNPSYMHSFGISAKYYVIAECPFTVQSLNLIARNRPFIENFNWNKNRGTRIWVIHRETGKLVMKKEIAPFFYFHFVNCFDTDKGVSFDLVAYPDAQIIQAYYLDYIQNSKKAIPGGKLTRINVNLSNQDVEFQTLSEAGIELPHMDYDRYNMNANYNYVYAPGLKDSTSLFYDQLIKIDIKSRTHLEWNSVGCYPGEPIFVPSPDSQEEDDGIILSLIIDEQNQCSFLLILDAMNFSEIARVPTPEPILAGFHCGFFKKEIA